MSKRRSTLKRRRQRMPAFVRNALNERDLMAVYRARPAYQQNDYLSWINRAKQDETKQRRLGRLLAELRRGSGSMNMPWRPRRAVER